MGFPTCRKDLPERAAAALGWEGAIREGLKQPRAPQGGEGARESHAQSRQNRFSEFSLSFSKELLSFIIFVK